MADRANGDAAHLMPPFIGQGLGAGLRDAHNLAWKLAAVLAGRADEVLLGSYARERGPHVRAPIRTALLVGRAMTGGGGPAALVRRPLAAAVLRLPGAEKRALAAWRLGSHPGPRSSGTVGTTSPAPCARSRVWRDRSCSTRPSVPVGCCCTPAPSTRRMAAAARAIGARTIDVRRTSLRSWLRSGRTTAALLAPGPRGGPHRSSPDS